MNTVVVGNGGREAACAQKLAEDPAVDRIWCVPGRKGFERISPKIRATLQPAGIKGDYSELIKFARQENVELTIVGPEVPLSEGIVDQFQKAKLPIFGPTQAATKLESSKIDCKHLMLKAGIPTANCQIFGSHQPALRYAGEIDLPRVFKADGLAFGKGVIIAHKRAEALAAVRRIMVDKEFGDAGHAMLVEELLVGRECSMKFLVDGDTAIPLLPAQDFKRAFNDDQGPNTGGMAAYSPVPFCTPAIQQQVLEQIVRPTIEAMKKAGTPFQGILYEGLMLTEDGPKVLEKNVRGGDPETLPILRRLKSRLLPYLLAVVHRKLHTLPPLEWHEGTSYCLVLASNGYPGDFDKKLLIEGIEAAEASGVTILHAGTAQRPDGSYETDGGRVLDLVGEDPELLRQAAKLITFGGQPPMYRTDTF